jgi:hypothetical protein
MKDCHTRARAAAAAGRAVAVVVARGSWLVARGRSNLGPNIPFKRLHILLSSVSSSNARPFLSVVLLPSSDRL